MAGGEGTGVGGVGENPVGGFPQAPTVRLRSTAEVTTIVVGICAAVQPNIGDDFIPMKHIMRDVFIPSLFRGLGEGTPRKGVIGLPVNQVGLALPYPTKTVPENCLASCVIRGHLVAALRG